MVVRSAGQGKWICSLRVFSVVFVLLCVFPWAIRAQKYIPADTMKVNSWLASAHDTSDVDVKKKFLLAKEALIVAKSLDYRLGIVNATRMLGQLHANAGETGNAFKYYSESIALSKEYDLVNAQGKGVYELGYLYVNVSLLDSAFICYTRALQLFQQTNDTLRIGNTYECIANVLNQMKNYQDAEKYVWLAIEVYRSIKKYVHVAGAHTNLGIIRFYQGRNEEAARFFLESNRLHDSLNSNDGLFANYQNLGGYYYSAGKKDSALYWYQRAMHILRSTGNYLYAPGLLINIGDVYSFKGNLDSAEWYYQDALARAVSTHNLSAAYLGYKYLAEMYSGKKKNFEKAYGYLANAVAVKDSIAHNEKVKSVAELTAKFEIAEAFDKNIILQGENDIQKLKLQRKDVLIYSICIIAILLLSVALLFARQNALSNKHLKIELEQKQLRAQMNPHFIFNSINSIQHFMLQADIVNANKYLTEFASLMRQTLDNARDGLIVLKTEITYLENYLSLENMQFEKEFSYSITCSNDINIDTIEIPSMILQPFVENAIRHGLSHLEHRKGMLHVRFYLEHNTIVCEIDDNGIGRAASGRFKNDNHRLHQSHGIELTKQRLTLFNKMNSTDYEIKIVDKVNTDHQPTGTTVIIKFSLEV